MEKLGINVGINGRANGGDGACRRVEGSRACAETSRRHDVLTFGHDGAVVTVNGSGDGDGAGIDGGDQLRSATILNFASAGDRALADI